MGITTPELSRATEGLAGERALLPLADAQRAVWLDIQRLGSRDAYQVGAVITLKTELDYALAREAVRMVMARHDSLRLRIDANEPIQWISADETLPVRLFDVSASEDPDGEVQRHVAAVHAAGFVLGDAPLFKADFLKVGPADWRVLLIVHHLIADGIAFAILQQQWLRAYGLLSGELDEAAAQLERSSYVPFINDDVAYGASKKAEEDLSYWRERLSPLPELLFEGRPRPDAPAQRKLDLFTLDKDGYAAFAAGARRSEATTHRAILALAAIALSRRYGQSDFALGMALHRRDSSSRNVLGMIAGLIPVRCTFDAAASLQASVAQVSKVLDQDLRHARTPIDTLGASWHLPPRDVTASSMRS